MNTKPRIQLSTTVLLPGSHIGGKYVCHDNLFMFGFGDTRKQAYDKWKSKESLRTRIPRRGMWNRISCKDWYHRGCPQIRVYIGHRQIVSYDALSDELVLRG